MNHGLKDFVSSMSSKFLSKNCLFVLLFFASFARKVEHLTFLSSLPFSSSSFDCFVYFQWVRSCIEASVSGQVLRLTVRNPHIVSYVFDTLIQTGEIREAFVGDENYVVESTAASTIQVCLLILCYLNLFDTINLWLSYVKRNLDVMNVNKCLRTVLYFRF